MATIAGEHQDTGDNWRDTILAGLANYIDAGSIVSGAAALALWQESYRSEEHTSELQSH